MKTKVFISWSGKDTESFKVAKKIADWLPKVLQNTDPFMSDNIHAGTNPINQIMDNLANSKIGIICITKENIHSTWLNFEAGALNNVVTTQSGVVIPILINMTTDEFASCNSPIKNLQGVIFDDNGIKKMLISINSCLEEPLKENPLNEVSSTWIPFLLNEKKTSAASKATEKNKIGDKEFIDAHSFLLREIVAGKNHEMYYNNDWYETIKETLDKLSTLGYIRISHFKDGSVLVKATFLGINYVCLN